MTIGRIARRIAVSPFTALGYLMESRFLPRALDALAYDTPKRIWLPLYLGIGQAVHPDVIELVNEEYPFVLAMTPYPFADGKYENPCILVSADGLRFVEELRGLNPLVRPPPLDHNDDPDLLFAEGHYYIFYLETQRPLRQDLKLLRSTDRVTWTSATIASYDFTVASPDPFIVSPSLVAKDRSFFLYYVNISVEPNRIEYLQSDRIGEWDIRTPLIPRFAGQSIIPWHVDVLESGGIFYLLVSDRAPGVDGRRGYELHLLRSRDLLSWTEPRKIFDRMPFGCRGVYRSTALIRRKDIFVYFSYESKLNEWKIAVVRKRLADFFGEDA
jgi:hypothetical protein